MRRPGGGRAHLPDASRPLECSGSGGARQSAQRASWTAWGLLRTGGAEERVLETGVLGMDNGLREAHVEIPGQPVVQCQVG